MWTFRDRRWVLARECDDGDVRLQTSPGLEVVAEERAGVTHLYLGPRPVRGPQHARTAR